MRSYDVIWSEYGQRRSKHWFAWGRPNHTRARRAGQCAEAACALMKVWSIRACVTGRAWTLFGTFLTPQPQVHIREIRGRIMKMVLDLWWFNFTMMRKQYVLSDNCTLNFGFWSFPELAIRVLQYSLTMLDSSSELGGGEVPKFYSALCCQCL